MNKNTCGAKKAPTWGVKGLPANPAARRGTVLSRTLTSLADFGAYRWRDSERMQKLVTKAIGASLICTLLSFDGFVSTVEAAEALSGDTLRQKIPGAKIQIDTPLGSVIPVAYGADGSLEGKAGAVAFFLGSQKDRGKWWIEGSKLCQRWDTWFNGRINCVRVYRNADNRIEWIDQDGEKGTGTIVELSGPPPAAPPSDDKVVRQIAASSPPKPVREAKPVAAQGTVARKAVELRPPSPVPVRVPSPPAPERKMSLKASDADKMAQAAPPPGTNKPVEKTAYTATYRVVNVAFDDVLNIRNGPSPLANIVSTIQPRAKGVMMAGNCEGEWCPVRHGQSQGWVNRYFLAAENGARRNAFVRRPSAAPITYKVVRVAAGDVLNLRRRPDGDAAIVATIPPSGTHIRLTGYCVGDWCPVEHGRHSGWAHRYFLALEF